MRSRFVLTLVCDINLFTGTNNGHYYVVQLLTVQVLNLLFL